MLCPECQTPLKPFLPEAAPLCSHCQHVFSESQIWQIHHYFSLRKQQEYARQLKAKAQGQIMGLEKDIDAVITVFQSSAVTPNVPLKKPAESHQELAKPAAPKPSAKPLPQKIALPFQEADFQWEKLLGFNLLLIIGVIFVLLGSVFFIRKVFVSGVLGPVGKLALIYLGALSTLGIGNVFRSKWKDFGLMIMGLGVLLLYVSTYTGFHIYGLLPQSVAFGLMFLVTLFTVILALREDNKALSILALCGGMATPVLLQNDQNDYWGLNLYLLILNLGFLGLALKKQWHILYYLGFLSTYGLFLGSLKTAAFYPGIGMLNLYVLLYSLYPFLSFTLMKNAKQQGPLNVLFVNATVGGFGSYFLLKEHAYAVESFAVITLGYTLMFVAMAIPLRNKYPRGFHVMSGLAALFVLITVPVLLSKQIMTITFFALMVILLWVGERLNHHAMMWGSGVLHIVLVCKLLCYDYPFIFGFEFFHIEPHYTHLWLARWSTLGFGLLCSWAATHKWQFISPKAGGLGWKTPSWSLFVLLLFFISNLEVHAFAHDYIPQSGFVAVSILWALFAMAMIAFGLFKHVSALRKAGMTLFFLTFVKVFFIDLAQLEITYKFISFTVIGIFLIFTSYLYRRFKDQLQGSEPAYDR